MTIKSTILLALASLVLVVATIDAAYDESLLMGKYEMTSDPKKEDYNRWLQAIKFSDAMRGIVRTIKLQVHLNKGASPNNYTVVMGTDVINGKFGFELGKEFQQTFPDGRQIKAVVTFEGNRIIANATLPTAKFVLDTEVSVDGLKATLICKDVVAVLKFARLKDATCKFC